MAEQLSAARCAGCGAELAPNKARGRARKWCSERCRKSQYDLVCVDCGGRVDGTTPGKMVNRDEPRCSPCAIKLRRIWTPEAVVLAIQKWADEHGGIPPAATDWNPNRARTIGHPERAEKFERDGCWPRAGSVQDAWGTWNAAIEAAGFEPRRLGTYGRPGEDPEIVRETVELYRSGLSAAQVAETLGDVGAAGVLHRLEKAGQPCRPTGRWPREEGRAV